MTFIKKLSACVLSAVVAASALVVPSYADEAYYGYNYDWYGDPIPSQNGYIVDRVVSGADLGVGSFSGLANIFVDNETEKIYLVDQENGRIIITEETFDPSKVEVMDTFKYSDVWTESQSVIKKTTLNKPSGIFVTHYKGDTLIYIADFANERVLACYEDGSIFMEYTKPSGDLYDANTTFNPKNIVVDNALNVYVVITSITTGMVQFSSDGSFNGYYGANRVEATAEVIANMFWKMIYTREQIMKMRHAVPIEIGNCDIDPSGFIYTVTGTKSSETDILKKLNPAGDNIYKNMGLDTMIIGDGTVWDEVNSEEHASLIEDVDVDENGNVFVLEFDEGRVFQYSDELDFEFVFGGRGTQKGTFTSPSGVENLNKKVYVTDLRKNTVTVFKLTEFGALVQEAVALFNKGLYEEAEVPFREVILRDSNYWFAYIGLGNAYYTRGEFETAMDYFYMNSRGGYNRAFKDFRMNFIRDNFTNFMIIIIVVIVLLVALSILRKQLKKKKAKKEAGGNV